MSFTSNFLKELDKQKAGGVTGANNYTKNFLKNVNTVPTSKKKKEDEVKILASYDDDIAPVKEERKWFDQGLFDDGYQFGDITKTILGTAADAIEDAGAGIIGMGEKTLDALAWLAPAMNVSQQAQNSIAYEFDIDKYNEDKKNAAEFIKKDLYDESAVARKIISDPLSGIGFDVEDSSVLGEKSDALAQSAGQLAATAGLQAVGVPWFLTTGATSFGSEAENALNQGATYEQAGMSAAISAGAEVLTEKLSGGIKFGGKAVDEALTKQIARGISNKTARTLARLGVDMSGEGLEEVISQVASNLGSSLYKEESLGELLLSEEAIDEYLESFIGGAALGGVAGGVKAVQSNKKGVDYVSGLNASEQTVVDALYKERLAEAGDISQREKSKIYDEVLRDMERGYISTDKIEELLGGETYKSYKDTADSEDAIFKEYEELGNLQNATLAQQERYRELIQQIQGIKTTSKRNELKTKLSEEVMGLVNGSRLSESYNEKARRGQSYEADLSQYNAAQQQVIQKAIDSGILNNTNRTHEFVDMVAKISADKGVLFDFTNNDRLKESGFAVDGKFVNGYVTKDGVTLNIDSAKSLNSVVGHEITHVLEGTDLYTELQTVLTEYAKTKGDYQGRYDALAKLYEGVEGANVDAELTADLVGDYLFTDSDFIHKLSTENRNIFQKVYDEIKYLCKVVTAGSKEARELEKVKRAFDKAYRESGKAKGDTKYSLSDSDGRQLSKGQQEYFKDSKVRDENGNLKVMYHGSPDAGFHVFDPKHSDDGISLFFVDRNDVAASYSGTSETYEARSFDTVEDANNFFEEIGRSEYKVVEKDDEYTLYDDGGEVATSKSLAEIYEEFCDWEGVGYGNANYKVYLNLKNPLVVDAKGRNWNNVSRDFSQEVADRYHSLTEAEKDALSDVAGWEEYGVFRDEMMSAAKAASDGSSMDDYTANLASAYEKLGGANANLFDAFTIASENFSEESIAQFAVKQMNTRDFAQRAKEQGYDGVIFNNIVDLGGYSNGSEGAATVAIAFDSNQIKSTANANPTEDADIRYSLSEDSEGRKLSEGQSKYFSGSKVVDTNGNLKVVYHGSPVDFNTFSLDYLGTNGTAEGYGFYFTDSKRIAEGYSKGLEGQGNDKTKGKLFEVYLDIKKPLSDTEVTMSRAQFKKFLATLNKQVDSDGEPLDVLSNYGDVSWEGLNKVLNYAMEIEYDGSESDVSMVHSIINGCGNMKTVFDVLRKTTGYDGIIVENATWGGDQKIYLAFHPGQIKNVDNKNPTSDPDTRFSLSTVGETPKRYGRYNVYGEDVRKTSGDDIAPIPDIPVVSEETLFPDDHAADIDAQIDRAAEEKAALDAESEQLYTDYSEQKISQEEFEARMTEINAKWMAADRELSRLEGIKAEEGQRFEALDDSDAPPETEAPYNEPPEVITLTKKAVDDIARSVRKTLSLTNRQMAELRGAIEDYSRAQYPDREKLRQYIADRFGHINESELNEELADVQRMLRSYKLNVSDHIKSDIADYKALKDSNFGKIRFSKEGSAVDQAYEELSSMFPGYFPEDITNPTDQFLRIVDVANLDRRIERSYELDDATLDEAADAIVNGINDFKQTQRQRQAERFDRDSFADLVKHGDEYAPPVEEDIAPVKQTAKQTETRKPNPRVANILTEESGTKKEKSGIGKKLVSQLVDKGMVFETLSLDTGNMELQSKYNYALPTNTEARAQHFMEHGAEGVKSLKEIKKTVNKSGKEKAFFDYLHHVHNIDRMTLEERFETPNKAVFGETVTADVSRGKAKQYEKSNPEFKEWAEDIYAYNKYLRKMLVDGNVISQKTSDLWEKMYPHYVPIRRVDDSGLNVNVPLDTNKTGVNAPIKRATGGSSDIEPLFNTMAQRTEQTFRAIARNDFGIELKNTLGTTIGAQKNDAGVDEMIDTIEAQEDHLLKPGTMHSNPTFTVFENGERVEFEITEDMFDALKPAGKILGYRNKPVSKVSNWRRNLLTTWNPVFALYRNPVKDLQEVAINSQHPAKTYVNIPNAVWQMATDGKYAAEYHKNGGKSNTYFDSRKNKFIEEDNLFKKAIGMPVRAIETAGEFIEEIPRLAEYIASRQAGRSVERSMLDAARVTTNFAAGGDFTKFLNAHGFNFLNASMQGASQHVRNFREATKQDGMKGFVKVLSKYVIAGLPGILLNNLLWDDDEEYEELSNYVKQNYYVVAKTEDGKFIRIPKGRTAAVVQNAMEQMQNLITGDDEVDFATFFELFMNNIAPSNPIENNILAPIIQTAKNEAWYGGDLVPSRLQDLPAAEQFDESTDAFSKWLGEKIDKSPYKINYLLDQYSGGMGDVFLPMMTPEAESGDNSLLGNFLAPLKKEISTDSVLNNKNPGDFYDLKDELEVMSNSKDATEEDTMRSMYMDSVSWEMSDLYQKKREIQNSDLPDDEKYEEVRSVQEQINALANNALDRYNDVNITGIYSEVGDRRYNYSEENGRWYEIKPKNADGKDNYFYQQEQKVTKGLGISYAEYWNNREEYDYAYDKPEKYTFSKAVGGYQAYRGYTSDLWDIKADKDENGDSIPYSRKNKVIEYINGLDADYYEKIILFKSEYNADDTYNYEIINHLNSREDISYEEMETILKELGFEVDSQGNITW